MKNEGITKFLDEVVKTCEGNSKETLDNVKLTLYDLTVEEIKNLKEFLKTSGIGRKATGSVKAKSEKKSYYNRQDYFKIDREKINDLRNDIETKGEYNIVINALGDIGMETNAVTFVAKDIAEETKENIKTVRKSKNTLIEKGIIAKEGAKSIVLNPYLFRMGKQVKTSQLEKFDTKYCYNKLVSVQNTSFTVLNNEKYIRAYFNPKTLLKEGLCKPAYDVLFFAFGNLRTSDNYIGGKNKIYDIDSMYKKMKKNKYEVLRGIENLIKAEIIKKDKKGYILNPFVATVNNSHTNETLNLFKDTKWNREEN